MLEQVNASLGANQMLLSIDYSVLIQFFSEAKGPVSLMIILEYGRISCHIWGDKRCYRLVVLCDLKPL